MANGAAVKMKRIKGAPSTVTSHISCVNGYCSADGVEVAKNGKVIFESPFDCMLNFFPPDLISPSVNLPVSVSAGVPTPVKVGGKKGNVAVIIFDGPCLMNPVPNRKLRRLANPVMMMVTSGVVTPKPMTNPNQIVIES